MMSETVPKNLPYNKACGWEDFADPELVAVMRDVYAYEAERSAAWPAGAELRKHWEVAMSVRALRDFGALRPDAEILGVGAGSEMTVFYLTRHARRVVATDLYLSPGEWEREAHPLMLVAPERLSRIPFERERLEALHMDGRWLRFPDDSFDGIFSSGSIEHFGDFEDIAAGAYELGRVLKPGGVLTLATELLLDGPPGSIGWPGVVLFSPEKLRREIVKATGLELVDDLDLAVSPRTLASVRPLLGMIGDVEHGRETYPLVVLSHEGQLFTSVHLTLRKTERYPLQDNAWARPSEALRARVRSNEAEAERRLFAAPAHVTAPAAPLSTEAPPAPAGQTASGSGEGTGLEEAFRRWDAVRARSGLEEASTQGTLPRALGFLKRTALRVRDLGISWDLQRDLFRALIDRQAGRADLEATVAGLKASEADILGALDTMWKLHEEQRTGGGTGLGDMGNLRDRQEILRVRQTRLEAALADLREEIAALRAPAGRLPLTPRDFAELLAELERDASAGEGAQAVEVSLQDVRAEDLLLVARRHFGGRLASSGPAYRGPNDLWIHVDFTAHWNRSILLDNAVSRLAPGGRFLLVTAPAAGEPPRHERLVQVEDREVAVAAGGPVRVLAWRREP